MSFKTLVLIVNIFLALLILFFSAIAFTLYINLGALAGNIIFWGLGSSLFFLLLLASTNIFFYKNKTIINCFLHQDWVALYTISRKAVFDEQSFSKFMVKYYLETAAILNYDVDYPQLEATILAFKPKIYRHFSHLFHSYYVMEYMQTKNQATFDKIIAPPKIEPKFRTFTTFNIAFAQIINENYEKALAKILEILNHKSNYFIKLLSCYLLNFYPDQYQNEDLKSLITIQKNLIAEKYPSKASFNQYLSELNAFFLIYPITKSLLYRAEEWFFKQ